MQYALVDGNRSQAFKGLKGVCNHCDGGVIAKCGNTKIHHWAHQNTKNCDPWWENETVWHREWKNFFSEKYREVLFVDKMTQECHRADIHTDKGITIEFQHSHIDSQEQSARESFYQNLVWVVDGTRLKRDLPRFTKARNRFSYISPGLFRVDITSECFPEAWVERSVPVVFDFLGIATTANTLQDEFIYCLLPKRLGRYGLVAKLSRRDFVIAINQGHWLVWLNDLIQKIQQVNQENEAQKRVQNNLRLDNWIRSTHSQRRRRL